jgi:hypothetical protein
MFSPTETPMSRTANERLDENQIPKVNKIVQLSHYYRRCKTSFSEIYFLCLKFLTFIGLQKAIPLLIASIVEAVVALILFNIIVCFFTNGYHFYNEIFFNL